MELQSPHYKHFTEDFIKIAKQYSLDPNKLKVEFYTPNCQAILIEQVNGHAFKIHINLEENRIISIKRLTKSTNEEADNLKEKYRKYMK
ncbi:MAG: hypothetical protein ACE5JB_05410 [bacterium]